MIIMYLRSSSYGSHKLCPQQYFIRYVLGIPELSNKKADKGTIVHKVMECLAQEKVAIQNGLDHYIDEQLGKIKVGTDIDTLAVLSYTYYTNQKSMTHHNDGKDPWTEKDQKDCIEWSHKFVDYNDGMFNPLNREIVNPEIQFDIEMTQPWAKYDYHTPWGEKLTGNLHIKGTIDLVTKLHDKCIEVIDWKTGKRLDWATGAVKDFKKLREDAQLRMYHYALSKMYPEVEDFLLTIFFVNDGGAYTVPFYKEDLPTTELMIRHKFEHIKSTQKPRLMRSWKCKSFCYFGKHNYPGTDKTYCEFIKEQTDTIGVEQTMLTYGDKDTFTTYQAPGT